MPPNSEIEKLERRWKENPRGTVFAPYAEVLRKNGDYGLAREVLQQGLELHPDHIPGNIVLGRCCLDVGEDGPAEAAFAHVLELDSENVIALKALAEITERQGRLLESSEWLSRLLAVDPSNDEARDQLARVESSREAAAAVITEQVTAQRAVTRPPEPVEAPEPVPAEDVSTAEVGSGVIGESGEFRTQIATPPEPAEPIAPPPPPPAPAISEELLSLGEAETVPSFPALGAAPSPPRIHDLETTELDLAAAAEAVTPDAVEGMMVDEVFAPPEPEAAPESPPVGGLELTVAAEEAAAIEIQASSASEFQAPDHSTDLLELKPGASEFQVPDASAELTLRTGGSSEYQTPSGAEELLARVSGAETSAEPPEPPLMEEPVSWGASPPSEDLQALAEAPTAELHARPLALTPPEAEAPSEPAEETGPAEEPAPETAAMALEDDAAIDTPEAAGEAEVFDTASAPSAPESATEGETAVEEGAASLKLIFPDEGTPAEAPRRRVSQEALDSAPPAPEAAAEPVEPEVGTGEPELVATETMAELYVRQGHLEEAANVYRALLEKQPNDARLAGRLRDVEAQRNAGRRRLSYVATETGGESVESFFRALASARPGTPAVGGSEGRTVPAAANPSAEPEAPAPTRPASRPLSLSAIFGEEPAAPPRSAPPAATPPPTRPGPDAFSFDQFFGGQSGSGSSPTIRRSGAQGAQKDEDLDQFQHWLKSLKR